MDELTLLLLRLGFLALLWIFVFAIVYSVRSDLFGTRARRELDAAGAAGATGSSSAAPVAPAATPQATVTERLAQQRGPTVTLGDTPERATRLVITSGPKEGLELELPTEQLTIGRSSESGLVIRDDYTSTHHAKLMVWNGQWVIQDLDSTNGTFLEGSRVSVPVEVPLGAEVKIGTTTFELRR